MVGFLRKKKSDKARLSDETALDRKGKVDGSSLLDGNGDPTEASLFMMRQQQQQQRRGSGQRGSDEENRNNNLGYPPVMATGIFPPQHSGYGYPQPPQQPFGVYKQPQQFGAYNQPQFGQPQYGQAQPPQQPYGQQYPAQQYPVQYGAPPQAQSPQYPVQYGHLPPPVSTAPAKKSRFRLPGYGKKN